MSTDAGAGRCGQLVSELPVLQEDQRFLVGEDGKTGQQGERAWPAGAAHVPVGLAWPQPGRAGLVLLSADCMCFHLQELAPGVQVWLGACGLLLPWTHNPLRVPSTSHSAREVTGHGCPGHSP